MCVCALECVCVRACATERPWVWPSEHTCCRMPYIEGWDLSFDPHDGVASTHFNCEPNT